MRFGEYILKLREAKDMSAKLAARELGITPQRLCDMEQGRRNFKRKPPMELLRRIAAVYDHPFTSLLENCEFFQHETNIINELITELEPVSQNLNSRAFEMVVEAKRYTPEMEALAQETLRLAQSLEVALRVVKARAKHEPPRGLLDSYTTRKAG